MTKTTPNQLEQERVRKRYDGMARTYSAVGQLIAAHRQEAMAALGVRPGEHIRFTPMLGSIDGSRMSSIMNRSVLDFLTGH